jgi:mevalonate kinase
VLKIVSDLGTYESPLAEMVPDPRFRFVLEAVSRKRALFPAGLMLEITSSFSDKIGFGSSAAVTVATLGALSAGSGAGLPEKETLLTEALQVVRAVQGRGSGTDLAASIWGGVIRYTQDTAAEALPLQHPLVAVYCGYKTPTPEVIRRIESVREKHPERYREIFRGMSAEVEGAWSALKKPDFRQFGESLNRGEAWMRALGVSTPELLEIVENLQRDPAVLGAKISGSGLGDCAVGWGRLSRTDFSYPVYALETDPEGVRYE